VSLNKISPEYKIGLAQKIFGLRRQPYWDKYILPSVQLLSVPQYEADSKWWFEYGQTQTQVGLKRYLTVKRIFDLLVVLISLPLTIPLLLSCALLIKLESPKGPAFFVQRRTGKDGHRFDMYKFRTMVPDAEAQKQKFAHLNELEPPDFKITHDPRITRIGRFLRKTSLDELPQIINVVLGNMSIVGPRPTSFSVDTYELWHTVRLEMQPGLTGLWQVIGRGSTEFDERVRLDYEYLQRRSLVFDFMIILHTFWAAFRGK